MEDSRLLKCYTVSLGAQVSSFPWIVTQSSGSSRLLQPLDPEEEDPTIIRNVGNYSPKDTA